MYGDWWAGIKKLILLGNNGEKTRARTAAKTGRTQALSCLAQTTMAFLRTTLALLAIPALLTSASPAFVDIEPRASATPAPVVNQTTCDGKQFTYQELAGYGFVASDARDKFGDTLGGYGSSIAIDRKSWTKIRSGTYTGTLYAIPDRGWYVGLQSIVGNMDA